MFVVDPVLGLKYCLTLMTLLSGYLGCPLIPCASPSAVSAKLDH